MTIAPTCEFRLIDCAPLLEEIAQDYGCITLVPKLESHRDYRASGCLMMRSLTSVNRLYIFDAEDFIKVKGFLGNENGQSQKVLNEYYEKYNGLHGFIELLRTCAFTFFCLHAYDEEDLSDSD